MPTSNILAGSYLPPGAPDYGLASSTNAFMSGQAALPYHLNLPGYGQNTALRSANTTNFLRGQLPQDVINLIQQQGAERGVATGVRGDSPNANAAWLRALGLTSLGLMQQGSQQFSQEISDTPVPEIWNPLSLYVPERLAAQELAAAKSGAGSTGGTDNFWGPKQGRFMTFGGGSSGMTRRF